MGQTTESKATVSLVLGILSIICLGPLAGIPGIIVALMARKSIASDPSKKGSGVATAGLVTSILGTVLGVLLGILLVVGTISIGNDAAESVDSIIEEIDTSTSSPDGLEQGFIDFDLEEGTCVAGALSADPSALEEASCDEAHDGEVYHVADLTGSDEFPGELEIDSQTTEECTSTFEGYVGTPIAESEYSFVYFFPTAASWAAGDREIACIAASADQVSDLPNESIKGSNR